MASGDVCGVPGRCSCGWGDSVSTFTAKYAGVCEACTERFPAGARVRYVAGGLVHAGCQDSELRVRRRKAKEVVCGVCFVIKPCRCEDGQ